MEKISTIKKVYCVYSDEETRGFFASVKRLQKDCEAAEAAKKALAAEATKKAAEDVLKQAAKREADCKREAAKNEAKQQKAAEAAEAKQKAKEAAEAAAKEAQRAKQAAEAVQKQINGSEKARKAFDALSDVMQRKQFRSEDINKDFLLTWLPELFNDNKELCSVKEVKLEDMQQTREAYKDTPSIIVEKAGSMYIYKPRLLFTANGFLSLFCKAADARTKQGKEAISAAEKEAKRIAAAQREAKRIAAARELIAKFEAKQKAEN